MTTKEIANREADYYRQRASHYASEGNTLMSQLMLKGASDWEKVAQREEH